MDTVSVNGIQGWIQDLDPMLQARFSHGCSSFFANGKKVLHLLLDFFAISTLVMRMKWLQIKKEI